MKIVNLDPVSHFFNGPDVLIIFPVTPDMYSMNWKKLYYLRWYKKCPLEKCTFRILFLNAKTISS